MMEDFIDRLRSAADIVSIISDYVPLKKKGRNFWGCCPFHNEKTPSFSVNPDKGFFYCFGCQAGGNVFNFIMRIENTGFSDAAKILAAKLNIPLPEKEKSEQDRAREKELNKLYQINEMARDFFHSCLVKTSYGKPALAYLASRGINDAVIERFKLGFAPPAWDKLLTSFLARGVDELSLLKAGLIVARSSGDGFYDRFRNRVMFPIADTRSRVVGFGGRVLDNSEPKYLNSPETPVFNKKHVLYGIDLAYKAIRDAGRAIVVEGYMDLISVQTAGFQNAVASLGTAFTPEQARLLLRHAPEIQFAYDSDAAGQNATQRALITAKSLGAAIRIVAIPDGKDPDEYIRKYGADAFRNLVQEAAGFVEYQINRILAATDYTGLEGKLTVISQALPVLASSDNDIEINTYITRLADVLSVDESAIRSEFRKYLRMHKKDKNVKSGNNINIVKISTQPAAATTAAERQIIRLMCEDAAIIPYVMAELRSNDFEAASRREIINSLFNAYNMNKSTAPAVIAATLGEEANQELSQIMLADSRCDNVTRVVDDCLRTIRLARLKYQYEQQRNKVEELERMGDSRCLQELAEMQRIKDEISKLYNA
ncbi:MAG: DNA primase [Negativicutes bacterium]|nr:DNA primase [Negativicutes bacterium]